MEKKMTYIDALSYAIDTLSAIENPNSEVIEKLVALKDSTEKRNRSKSKAQIAKENANEDLGNIVIEVLSNTTEAVTITELLALDERFEGIKAQKMSPIIRKLMEQNKVKREEIKHKAYFSLV